MPRDGLIRNNHSFLRYVYSIGKEINPNIDIEDDAMIEIYNSMEKLMTHQIRYACHLCKLERKKRVSEHHLERVTRNYLKLVNPPHREIRENGGSVCEKDNLLQKQERMLEIRNELRVLRMNEVRNETLGNLKKYRKEMRKRTKSFKRMR